ncbi:MAG: hypothetical protein P8M04_08025 [Akkermansiaceae bacterium]|nr:hypothetical protein [Akkermansiaceae bacterium]
MSDYEKEATTASGDSGSGGGVKTDLSSDFVPLTPAPVPSPSPPFVKPVAFSGKEEVVKTVEESAAAVLKPTLGNYPVRKPSVKVGLLDPAKVYGEKEETESVVSSDIPMPISEGFLDEPNLSGEKPSAPETKIEAKPRYPSIKPVALDREKIYPVVESEFENIELTLDDESAFKVDITEFEESIEGKVEEVAKPIIPDPDRVAELVTKKVKSTEQIEVLGPERLKHEELSVPEKKLSKWTFWKRPSKRDQQLARISEGYLEMVDLVRSIRGQLDSQSENNMILRESLVHLPQAIKGLDQGIEQFRESQHVVGKTLGEIHTQLKFNNERDHRLAGSMDGFNDTLKGMDETSRETMETFDRVQERMKDSDIRMENFFQNVQDTEEKVSETMVRLQRNMALMHYIFLGCLIAVIGVLVFTVIMKKDEAAPPQFIKRVEPKSDSENK